MTEFIQHIGLALKDARLKKGLSQRSLGKKAGIHQSHLSKIEAGVVDLQISSLIELSRALELELMLIPRRFVPAVRAVQQVKKTREMIPIYRLEGEEGEDD